MAIDFQVYDRKKEERGVTVVVLSIYRLRDDIELPKYGTSMSNCFDLSFQPTNEERIVKGYNKHNDAVSRHINGFDEFLIEPGDRLLVPTGLICKIEQRLTVETFSDIAQEEKSLASYSIRLHPRSGLSLKRGLILANCEGIVDVDYQEEIFVLLTNISEKTQSIAKGDRIAQAEVVSNMPNVSFIALTARPEKYSERSGGFGSTGISS